MDRWDKSFRDGHHRRGRENPSFSSTLLDAIYRSIDEGNGVEEEEIVLYRETMRKKQSAVLKEEKWTEKKVSEKVVVRKLRQYSNSAPFTSTSSSSDSSCNGGCSSSELDSIYGVTSKSSGYAIQRPKPIRTHVPLCTDRLERPRREFNTFDRYTQQQKPKQEGSFVKTKSRALKIYGDLKKVKQPISPGGRLANFLNSLFTAGNAKKAKMSSSPTKLSEVLGFERQSKSTQASTCSSASSFSRSCLSKTPSSRGKSSNGVKRSVRFYPESVIVDEDSRPCGYKCLYEDDEGELKPHLMEKNRRVEEAARQLLSSYQQKKNEDYHMRDVHSQDVDFQNYDEDDDDAASCSSSDLFELDNFALIGIDRYREELPVYETTRLDRNQAIANGMIL